MAAGAFLIGRPGRAALIASPYAVALCAAYATTARKVEPEARPFIVPAFVAMHVGWGIGFWQATGRRLAAAVRAKT
jgi:hypothetical protein